LSSTDLLNYWATFLFISAALIKNSIPRCPLRVTCEYKWHNYSSTITADRQDNKLCSLYDSYMCIPSYKWSH